MMNGENKGEIITFTRTRSESGVFDENLREGNDVFVSLNMESDEWNLDGVKRDQFLALAAAVFILAVALAGRLQRILAVVSVLVNVLVFSMVVSLYIQGVNILIPTIFAVISFSVFSILFYCGFRLLSFVAILATLC